MQTIAPQTFRFIKRALLLLDNTGSNDRSFRNYLYYRRWPWESSKYFSIEECREIILDLESHVRKLDMQGEERPVSEVGVDNRYPIFHDTMEVIPVYKDALLLECHRPLVLPGQIPSLLYFLKIPGFKEGVDVENHQFGFHFHYGKVKSNAVVRTNLLLTFDPVTKPSSASSDAPSDNRPLYGERHAEGKCKKIEIETIGVNKRRPIYLVCHEVGGNKGFSNFKRPSMKATVFYSGV